jgi:hypothetical protein
LKDQLDALERSLIAQALSAVAAISPRPRVGWG